MAEAQPASDAPSEPGLAALATGWPELSAWLDRLLDLDAAERLQVVQQDPTLEPRQRAQLLRLLAGSGVETGELLAPLSQLGAASVQLAQGADPTASQVGAEVGPYRLVRALGEGGMGSVWLAERREGPALRPVALKLPRLAWGGALAERLGRERDILAALEHPHIARLFDAGVDAAGRPWLALEVVEGLPLDEHARRQKLPLRARVALLLEVASAVSYAHARLVVHRDLKPSNILVAAVGGVKLLDFGIAKPMQGERAESTALTRAAGRALTPAYASPEQIRGEPLGVASDVYSLGVVAYELLAGARPHRAARDSAAALEEAVLTQDAPAASRTASEAGDADAARALRGDLDAILNRALKPLVAERYPTVDAFADDLRRWLNHEPVSAQPDRAAYRLRKFVRRHRGRVVAGGLVTAALLAGAGVSLWQAHRAEAARAAAEREAATARAVQGFLESVFRSNSGDQAQPGVARVTTARDLLDRGAARIGSELRDQPAARLRMLEVLAGMYEDLSELGRMRQMAELRLAQARELPPPQGPREQVAALAHLAHALALGGREVDARTRLDEAEALLSSAQLTDPTLRLAVLVRRASVLRADDPARSAKAAEQALAIASTLPASPAGLNAAYLAAEARNFGGQPERALPVIRDAIALLGRQPELGASILAPLHTLQGEAEAALGRLDAAEASYRRGIEVERARGGSGVLPHLLTVQLARFLARQERWREVAELIGPTAAWARNPPIPFETTVPMASATEGEALLHLGRPVEGLAALDLAVDQVGKLQDAADVAPRIQALRAAAWVRVGRLADAERALAEIDRGLAERGQPTAPQIEWARRELQLARGQAALAMEGWRAERAARQRSAEPDPAREPLAATELAMLLHAAGRAQAAADLAQAALAAYEPDPQTGRAWRGLGPARAWRVRGEALAALGQTAAAEQALAQARARLGSEGVAAGGTGRGGAGRR
jgi:serine/threonine-protein kinase